MENGVHWKNNKRWLAYNDMILSTDCNTFNEALSYACIYDKIKWLPEKEDDGKKLHIERWNDETIKWVKTSNGKYKKIPLFAAIPYCIATLPFEYLEDDLDLFSEKELGFLNWFRDYYDIDQICWKRAPKHKYSDELYPIHPGAFVEWMNENHDKSTWWINWCAYERQHNLPSFLKLCEV